MADDTSVSGIERSLEAEPKNGVYIISVHSERVGYTAKSAEDQELVSKVTVNGRYIGTSDYFEVECDDYEIDEDGVLNFRCVDTGTEQEGCD